MQPFITCWFSYCCIANKAHIFCCSNCKAFLWKPPQKMGPWRKDMCWVGVIKGDLWAYYLGPGASPIQPCSSNSRAFNNHKENGAKWTKAARRGRTDRFLIKLYSCSSFHCYFNKEKSVLQKVSWRLWHQHLLLESTSPLGISEGTIDCSNGFFLLSQTCGKFELCELMETLWLSLPLSPSRI